MNLGSEPSSITSWQLDSAAIRRLYHNSIISNLQLTNFNIFLKSFTSFAGDGNLGRIKKEHQGTRIFSWDVNILKLKIFKGHLFTDQTVAVHAELSGISIYMYMYNTVCTHMHSSFAPPPSHLWDTGTTPFLHRIYLYNWRLFFYFFLLFIARCLSFRRHLPYNCRLS